VAIKTGHIKRLLGLCANSETRLRIAGLSRSSRAVYDYIKLNQPCNAQAVGKGLKMRRSQVTIACLDLRRLMLIKTIERRTEKNYTSKFFTIASE
jgi:hypothetical protein